MKIKKSPIQSDQSVQYIFLESKLAEITSATIKLPKSELDAEENFSDFGFDSILGNQLVNNINKELNISMSSTEIFNYPNLRSLTAYILEHHPLPAFKEESRLIDQPTHKQRTTDGLSIHRKRKPRLSFNEKIILENEDRSKLDIAIVGMSGAYGSTVNLALWWESLLNGESLIREVPENRWSVLQHYNPVKGLLGKTYSKWGSFLTGIDLFDPLFFKISGREAEGMDPQQRLFLEHCWHALEDAGITPAQLDGKKCGVYVGATQSDYVSPEQEWKDASVFWGNSSSILASRISYYLNLKGPAVAVDTACSSSLVALDLACKSLILGETDMAISGGVMINTTPLLYKLTSRSGMLSEDGQCYTFDHRANGFVPGEGVGVLVLKRLEDAEISGDNIYGVIKGIGTNQDGTTNGITAPSGLSQEQLEKMVYEKYKIDPGSITYVEAHGTGTSLGDPIEFEALTKAFRWGTDKVQYCGLGSVKTNIGHAQLASGVAGVQKVLLSMQHRVLPATLNYERPNPLINIEESPFYINTKLKDWDTGNNQPRMAAVSSFGFSGTNAHIVLEEYRKRQSTYQGTGPYIVPLSAKNEERLDEMVVNLLSWLDGRSGVKLYDVAYTLQVGRESMTSRLALVVNDLEDLKTQLADYREGNREGLLTGNTKKDNNDFVLKGKAGEAYLREAIANRESESLARLWVKGVAIDWSLLYGTDNRPSKISLPTYPFARERYWIPNQEDEVATLGLIKGHWLHPLLHRNDSDMSEQKYTSVFSGKESFLSDHKVKGERVFPGAAYLELAREAGEQSIHKRITRISDVTWQSPVVVNGPSQEVHIGVFEEGSGLGYEVYSNGESGEVVHGQGRFGTEDLPAAEVMDISLIQDRLTGEKSGDECYALFGSFGLGYGSTFRGIDTLYYNTEEALSKLTLPKEEGYVLQPGLLDSALQTYIGLSFASTEESNQLMLPFSVKEVNIHGEVDQTCWAYVRKGKSGRSEGRVSRYDIDMLSEAGEVLLSFRDFVVLPANGFESKGEEVAALRYYGISWEGKQIADIKDTISSDSLIVLAGGSVSLAESLTARLAHEVIAINEASAEAYYVCLQGLIQGRLSEGSSVQVMVMYRNQEDLDYGFISGLLKTARLENPKLSGKTIGIDILSLDSLDSLVDIIESEAGDVSLEVRYKNNRREVKSLSPLKVTSKESISIEAGGVYLITGGCGGLGKLFAEHISGTRDTRLILTGRRESSPLSAGMLSGLRATYHSCDVTDQGAVEDLIKKTLDTHGRLDGIIHSAGVIRDSFLLKKTNEEAEEVLSPKILGVKHLDQATKGVDLDFVVYCSSVSGVMGNVGQADYASGNAYMDNYAEYRNEQVAKGNRSGHTLSINWPLWQEGGMQVDVESEKYLERTLGVRALPTRSGLEAFIVLLQQGISQGMVVYGLVSKMDKKLSGFYQKDQAIASATIKSASIDSDYVQDQAEKIILQMVAKLLKLDVSNLSVDEELGDYGFDSILMTHFANNLNDYYQLDLQPTVFFNHPTIEELTAYLMTDHAQALVKRHGDELKPSANLLQATQTIGSYPNLSRRKKRFAAASTEKVSNSTSSVHEPIAIVGMSGRFPGSPDLETFWENLKENKDLITEVPKDRWNWEDYYGDATQDKRKTKAKWGGFIEDVDKFDSLHFSISPREAELMDPQQRITLQAVWHALEDAGIAPVSLKGNDTGIFVGSYFDDYANLLIKSGLEPEGLLGTGLSQSLVSNRISYLFDFHGPSETINTACSSSLVAIHRAVENIRNGNCKLVIAGGVSLDLIPDTLFTLTQAGMLSEDGRCKTFDQSANGYVRGEGVGMVVLKPLSQAQADGDRIHAVIRSASENHGGKANTLTSPNPKAQQALLLKAYRQADIDPRHVSYIETHGTGTPLGDPVEVEGLKGAFKELYRERGLEIPETPHIRLGTVKTNIGHLESAAGIAGVLKVVQSMKHGMLPGNPHLQEPNKYLQLEGTPFELQRETTVWDTKGDQPRIAGVSSFGFGGSNAHIVLEEYRQRQSTYQGTGPYIVPLSAKNEERLDEMVVNLLSWLKTHGELSLHDIAYTLQVGRESMDSRLALVVNDLEDLKTQLTDYREGNREGLLTGNIKKDQSNFLLKGGAGQAFIRYAVENKETESLAQLWLTGASIDWGMLYVEGMRPNKISLPTYPFAQERHWISVAKESESNTEFTFSGDVSKLDNAKRLHYFTNIWKEKEIVEAARSSALRRIVILCGSSSLFVEKLSKNLGQEVIALNEDNEIENYLKVQKLLQSKTAKKEKVDITIVYRNVGVIDFGFLRGLLKTALLENPRLSGKMIGVEHLSFEYLRDLTEIIQSEQRDSSKEVQYYANKREVRELRALSIDSDNQIAIKKGGIYLITGGGGGIGKHLANYLSETADTRIILTGRRENSPLNSKELDKLHATYQCCDVTDKGAVESLIEYISKTYGTIDGIIHSAGVIRDSFLPKKTEEEAKAVLAPKVTGLKNLDEATKDLNLDFVVYCSSVAGVMGNVGQADYASGNAFMDDYAHYRNKLQSEGKRQGFTVSINWPYWMEGGMILEEEYLRILRAETGMEPLETSKGIEAFKTAMRAGHNHFLVACGDFGRLKSTFLGIPLSKETSKKGKNSVREATLDIFSNVFGFKNEETALDHSFDELGANSIMLMQLRNELEKQFNIPIHIAELMDKENLGELLIYLESELHAEQQEIQENALNQHFEFSGATPLASKIISEADLKISNTIIVLAPPRSGSTLLRVMLAGHSRIFAPPELYLLNHASMGSRALNMQGNKKIFKEGLIQALSTLYTCDIAVAKKIISVWEEEDVPVSSVYAGLHEKLDGKFLVDKTPLYSLDYDTLLKSEEIFEAPVYIHLQRHPLASIGSFVTNRFHKMFSSDLPPWKFAEHCWTQSHDNIQTFLGTIPAERKLGVAYEDLVKQPEAMMREICVLLGIAFEDQMCFPYDHSPLKMSNGLNSVSKMIGDPKFLKYTRINPAIADSWKTYVDHWETLDTRTHDLAASLNYNIDKAKQPFVNTSNKSTKDLKSISVNEPIKGNFDGSIVNSSAKQRIIHSDEIVIVGVSGRFAGSEDVNSLWKQSQMEGKSAFTSNNQYELSAREINFDRIGLTSDSYKAMDRQQQLVFEMLYHTLEDAKITKEQLKGSNTGVFIAAAQLPLQLSNPSSSFKAEDNLVHMLSAKISFYLDLHGPSEVFNVSCVSTYVAIDRAVQSLHAGDCDQAIVGAVNIITTEVSQYRAAAADLSSLLSISGAMKSFDNTADGIVPSEGVGVLLLKKKTIAENAQNKIYCLIKGTSFAHGGKSLSWESPNPKGLNTVILNSIEKSGVDVDTIDYIEAHGIANPVADSIELSAINKAYKKLSRNPNKKWHVGSIKPVIGHPGLASGMASLLKVLKAFEHKIIPGISGLGEVTRELNPNHSLILPKTATTWENGDNPRRAALNSYAVGGVNAHIILEEFPTKQGNFSLTGASIDVIHEAPVTDDKDSVIKSAFDPLVVADEDFRDQILSLAAEVFEIARELIDLNASPVDYDFDSVQVITFVGKVNEYFGIEAKMGQIIGADNFASIFSIIESAISASKTSESKAAIKDDFPVIHQLSEGQKGLYFIQVSNPLTVAYNVPIAFEVAGEVDSEKIYQLVESLLEVHPVLRTIISVDENDALVQEIQPVLGYLQRDISHLKEGETLTEAFQELQKIPFDLSKGVFRLYVRRDGQKTGLLFIIHHIVMDGTSAMILALKFQELFRAQKESNTALSLLQDRYYFEFINRERSYLESKAAVEDLAYWTDKLVGNTEPLSLPYDFVTEAEWSGSSAGTKQLSWSGEELQGLKKVAKLLRVNLSVLFLSAFKVLLYRLTGMEKISVRIPTAGRSGEQYMESIGFYVNMMLSVDKIASEESYTTYVSRIRKGFTSDIDYLRYPYPKLLTTLKLIEGDDVDRFPASFVYQNIFDAVLAKELSGNLRLVETISQEISDSYTMEVLDLRDRLTVKLKYRKDRFLPESIMRHLVYYRQILETMVSNPEAKIADTEILSEGELHQLLNKFNDTTVDYPKDDCFHELFEEQVERTPDKVALVFEETEITYRELEKRSRQMAVYLQEQGVVPNNIVGIFMERSIEVIVAMLGILRAGGAYVPLDPDYPQERIGYMIKDSLVQGNGEHTVKLLLTQESLRPTLELIANGLGVTLISLQPDWDDNHELVNSREKLKKQVSSKDLAYVIYTSGSTGRPKGVMIEHGSLSNFVKTAIYDFKLTTSDIVLQQASISFDISIEELFPCLAVGARLAILNSKSDDIDSLLSFIRREKVNLLSITPGLVNELNNHSADLANVRLLISGGDQLQPYHISNLFSKMKICNTYGPTEATVSVTHQEIQRLEDSAYIGYPKANCKLYILNKDGRLNGINVPGELCIAGAGLARGYLNRPELTAEKFIDNPFGEGKIYRTGDLVRWLADGNIEFLGRMDNQVKIRGYRIELSEIEAALNGNDAIQSAVVIAKEKAGVKQLLAYYVTKQEGQIDTQELKRFLSLSLPEYMVPTIMVPIKKIPLTPNGKTDRKDLIERELGNTGSREYVAPRTETQQKLAGIWKELLGIDQVGINDNFFELGGRSLMTMALVHRMRSTFDVAVSLKSVINASTLDEQAVLLENKHQDSTRLDTSTASCIITFIPPKGPIEEQVATYIIPGMPGVVDDYYSLADSILQGPVYGLQMYGVFQDEKPLESVEEIASHNLKLIKSTAVSNIHLVAHSYGGIIAYEMLRQLQKEDVAVNRVILLDCHLEKKQRSVGDRIRTFLLGIGNMKDLPYDLTKTEVFIRRVIRQPKSKRASLIYNYLTKNGMVIDQMFFERLYQLYDTSMNIKYQPEDKLPYDVSVIRAKNQLIDYNDRSLGWSPYYQSVEVIESEGNHFEIVQAPFVHKWIEKIRST